MGTEAPEPVSPYAKQLLRTLGGDPKYLGLSAAVVSRWALDRPEAVLNLVDDEAFFRAAANLPADLLKLSESELAAFCPPNRPSRLDRRVRIYFWEAYEEAAKKHHTISLEGIVKDSGVPSWSEYRNELLTTPVLLAWMLCPPAGYKIQMKEALDLGLKRLMDILEIPVMDPVTKKVSPAVAALHIQAFRLIDQRVNGAITQKIVSIGASAGTVPEGAQAVDHSAIDQRLLELEKILQGTALSPPPQILLPEYT